jgi:hypothetical protein
MNLTISTPHSPKTFKTGKSRSLATIAATALVLTTMAGVATFSSIESNAGQTETALPAPASRSTLRISPDLIPARPMMTYYLVSSEEQRDAVQAEAQWQAEDNAVYNPAAVRWQYEVVLMSGNAAEDAAVLQSIDEVRYRWQAVGASGLEVVDLRPLELRHSLSIQQAPIFIYLVESQESATNLLSSIESDRNESETPAPVFHAFKVASPEEEAWVSEFRETLQGRNVQVIDVRNLGPIE